MIQKIEIENYRSCQHTSLSPQSDLSVLIGPNGSGKTNVLNSLLMLQRLCFLSALRPTPDKEHDNECQMTVSFAVASKEARLSTTVKLETDESNKDTILSSRELWSFGRDVHKLAVPLAATRFLGKESVTVHGNRTVDGKSVALMRDASSGEHFFFEMPQVPKSVVGPLGLIGNWVSGIKYYGASQFTNPSQCPVSFEIDKDTGIPTERYYPAASIHRKFLLDLYQAWKTEADSNWTQFFEIIGRNGIGLIDNVEFKEIPTSSVEYTVKSGGRVRQRKREKVLVIPQFSIGSNQLSPSQLSEGTFKTITLLFYLITDKSTALLIEEPEVCVHHGLLSSIVELVKTYSRQKQIVMSTHSDFVLDQVEPRNVYKVIRGMEGTEVAHVTEDLSAKELAALRRYMESEGNLGEYWRHGGFE